MNSFVERRLVRAALSEESTSSLELYVLELLGLYRPPDLYVIYLSNFVMIFLRHILKASIISWVMKTVKNTGRKKEEHLTFWDAMVLYHRLTFFMLFVNWFAPIDLPHL